MIDSGATRGFISVNAIKPLGLSIVKEQTFLELGDGQKILSRGKVLDIPVVTAGLTTKMDFTVTSLLHDVDLILGINWLQLVNPLIDWKLNRLFLPDAMGTTLLPSDWLDAQQTHWDCQSPIFSGAIDCTSGHTGPISSISFEDSSVLGLLY